MTGSSRSLRLAVDEGVAGLGLVPGRAVRPREGRTPRIDWAPMEPGGTEKWFARSHIAETQPYVSADLDFALELADAADAISLPRFRARDFVVNRKPDLTPVTDADRAVEQALRAMAAERGEDVFGEEFGGPEDGVRWIVDPIDGTKNFTRGIPVWATLIALERDSELVCGVVSAPALGRRWWAVRGEGAFANGVPIHVSSVALLADAAVSAALAADLAALEDRAWHARALGDFWPHVLVAEGALDAAIDYPLQLWDYAALVPIVEEAGGRTGFTAGGGFFSSNGLIDPESTSVDAP